jgi:hypothetical protein
MAEKELSQYPDIGTITTGVKFVALNNGLNGNVTMNALSEFVGGILEDSGIPAEVSALSAGQSSNAIYAATWADLSSVSGTFQGQGAFVTSDTGTHTDPVSGETVSNSGQYRWTGSAWQWLRADTLSQVRTRVDALMETKQQPVGLTIDPVAANTAGANTRIIASAAAQDSTLGEVTLYALAAGTIKVCVFSVAGTTYTRLSAIEVVIASAGSKTLTAADFGSIVVQAGQCVGISAPAGVLTYRNGVAGFAVASIAYDAASGTAAPVTTNTWQIGAKFNYVSQVATGAAVKALQDGRGGIVTASFAGIADVSDAQRVFVTNLPTGADVAYKSDGIWRDSRGVLLSSALGPCSVAGVSYYFSARDVSASNGYARRWSSQDGAIALTSRSTTPAIDRRGIVATAGRAPILLADGAGTAALGSAAHSLVEVVDVPTAPLASPASGGFTCTGMTRDAAGYWLVGNFGQATFTSPFTPAIEILSPSRRKLVQEIPLLAADFPGIQGIQGVAWDSTDDTIWFVDTANKLVRHITRAGVKIGDEIDMSAIGEPNGIAYVPSRDALWISISNSPTCYLRSCVDGAALDTCTVQASADQLHWDDVNKYLYTSYGANGANGNVEVRDTITNGVVASYLGLVGSQSIEGIWANGQGTLFVANDGGYHTEAAPALHVICQYAVTVPPPAAHGRKLTVGVVLRQVGTPGYAQALIGEGDPTRSDIGGWALFLSGSNQIRFMARDLNGTAAQADWTVAGLSGSGFKRLVLKVDLDAGSAALQVDGAVVSGTIAAPLSNVVKSLAIGGRLAAANIFGQRNLNTADLSSWAVGADVDAADLLAYLTADTRGLPT